jgi:acyl-CoA thioester hydrolase
VDTDASGRIHYTALFRHLEEAEQEFLRYIGRPYKTVGQEDITYPRVHVEADYTRPLRFDDEIGIEVFVHRIGQASFTLGFRVTCGDAEAARARYVIACMNLLTQRSSPLPPEMIGLLRPFLKS